MNSLTDSLLCQGLYCLLDKDNKYDHITIQQSTVLQIFFVKYRLKFMLIPEEIQNFIKIKSLKFYQINEQIKRLVK